MPDAERTKTTEEVNTAKSRQENLSKIKKICVDEKNY